MSFPAKKTNEQKYPNCSTPSHPRPTVLGDVADVVLLCRCPTGVRPRNEHVMADVGESRTRIISRHRSPPWPGFAAGSGSQHSSCLLRRERAVTLGDCRVTAPERWCRQPFRPPSLRLAASLAEFHFQSRWMCLGDCLVFFVFVSGY